MLGISRRVSGSTELLCRKKEAGKRKRAEDACQATLVGCVAAHTTTSVEQPSTSVKRASFEAMICHIGTPAVVRGEPRWNQRTMRRKATFHKTWSVAAKGDLQNNFRTAADYADECFNICTSGPPWHTALSLAATGRTAWTTTLWRRTDVGCGCYATHNKTGSGHCCASTQL